MEAEQRVVSLAELSKHKEQWIAVEGAVYDVAAFAPAHPGGAELLEEHMGTDATEAFAAEGHSDSARLLLKDMKVGVLEGHEKEAAQAAQMEEQESEAEELAKKVIDPSKPYTFQVGRLGKLYNEWVHKPMHVEKPLVLLGGWMEPFTKVYWWVPLVVWIPAIIGMLYYSHFVLGYELWRVVPLYLVSVTAWPFLEYFLHRYIYHFATESYWANTLHFLMHGVHHLTPMDDTRLVAPPPLAVFVASPVVTLIHMFAPSTPFAWTMTAGLFSGYLVYDEIHYWVHFGNIRWEWLRRLRAHHMEHHYSEPEMNYGVSNIFTDELAGTNWERQKAR